MKYNFQVIIVLMSFLTLHPSNFCSAQLLFNPDQIHAIDWSHWNPQSARLKPIKLPLSLDGESQDDTFAILIENVLTPEECMKLVEVSESYGNNYQLASGSNPDKLVSNQKKNFKHRFDKGKPFKNVEKAEAEAKKLIDQYLEA